MKIRTCIYICTYMQHYDYELHDTYSERNFSWSTAPGVPVCGCRMRVFRLFVRCRIRESCLSRLSLSIYLSIIVSLHLSFNLSPPLLSSPPPPLILSAFSLLLKSVFQCLAVSQSPAPFPLVHDCDKPLSSTGTVIRAGHRRTIITTPVPKIMCALELADWSVCRTHDTTIKHLLVRTHPYGSTR